MQLLDNDAIAAWIFLTPALILLGVFIIWPIAYLFYLSFTAGSFTSTGTYLVGFKNYWRLLLNSDFWQVLFNTFYFTVATVIPSLLIPLGLAVLLNRSFALRGILRSAYFLPSIISLVAAGLGFRWLFQTAGPVNAFLGLFGIPSIPWLGDTFWAMPVLILLSIWKQLGFNAGRKARVSETLQSLISTSRVGNAHQNLDLVGIAHPTYANNSRNPYFTVGAIHVDAGRLPAGYCPYRV
ncbi:hypothetical protein Cal7507_4087 [Calothrix sp. PCC 7507]|nr:hypothetical protein Cal7507_4087 [Calothrix sp. PCC 7507]